MARVTHIDSKPAEPDGATRVQAWGALSRGGVLVGKGRRSGWQPIASALALWGSGGVASSQGQEELK